jgi:hypothetical protein
MHSSRNGLTDTLAASTLALMLVVLWLLMRGYQGFAGDAQIYAFQALARIHPALSVDLYLQNTSQDQFTIFSPFYASLIGWLGLENATRLLTVFFSAWIMAAAWNLTAALVNRSAAWLAVAFLVVAAGDYGAAGVFRIFEHYLTARLPAEALVLTAFACYARGARAIGLAVAAAAMLVHPLMALPGLLLLICLWFPIRVILLGALGGAAAALGIALSATLLPAVARVFTVMDAEWLSIVRERSQFLFLQLWSLKDWDINVRPLLFLAFIAGVHDARLRRFCIAAVALSACGLAVALIACLAGPVAVLVQGQAWRWIWIACLLSTLLLPETLLRVWRDEKCGRLCAVLLIGGWVGPAFADSACILLTLWLWSMRAHIGERTVFYFRWLAAAAGIAALAWVIASSGNRSAMTLAKSGDLLGVKVSAVFVFGLLWWLLRRARTPWLAIVAGSALLISSIFLLPASFKQARTLGLQSDIEEFSDWAVAIPPTSTVLVAPARDVGSFVWFTLGRPNYLALDQSAGVVFSRKTALEIRRRSELLLPLTDPTWKILSGIRDGAAKLKDHPPTRPLTTETLIHVCSDPRLGFVISPEKVGFDSLRHEHPGGWAGWNLYDCRRVRPPLPTT